MAKANCQRQLTACRNTKDGRAVGRKGYTETGSYPCTDVPDEKRFMRSEPLRIELWRILVKPQRLVGNVVHANDHGRRQIRSFKNHAPLRDHLAVTGKYNRLGRIWRDVHRDPPTRVVVERLANEFSRDRHSFELRFVQVVYRGGHRQEELCVSSLRAEKSAPAILRRR